MPPNPNPLVAIVGPTAVGKTRLAVELCQRFGGEVINADSRQVYRGMDIGTAKPTPEELSKAPHHLLDQLDPSEHFGLGAFLPLAKKAAADIATRGKLPIVAGGTGQYVWAMLEGQTVPAVPPDPELRASLDQVAEEQGAQALHDRLRQVDPDRADALDARNVRRVVRALEIFHSTNQKPSELVQAPLSIACDYLVIGLTMDRKALYQRIDDRVDSMMESGFLAEVGRLAQAGYPMGHGALDSPGYRELGLYINGELSLEESVSRTKTQTHRLARRQYTWFKLSDPRIQWLDAAGSGVAEQASELLSAYLSETNPVVQ